MPAAIRARTDSAAGRRMPDGRREKRALTNPGRALTKTGDCHTSGARYPAGMIMLFRLSMAVVASGGLTVLPACTRTSDGSIVPARSLAVPRLPGFASGPAVYSGGQPSVPLFPATPEPPPPPVSAPKAAKSLPAVKVWKGTVKPPFRQSGPQDPVTCGNEQSAGGRVRVVCQ